MAEEFKAGDVVKLKSGGPVMTVTQAGTQAMTGRNLVWCTWFSANKGGHKLEKGEFPPDALQRWE